MRAAILLSVIATTVSGSAVAAVNTTPPAFYVGTGQGVLDAQVNAYSANKTVVGSIAPFPGFKGGVRVASGDVNGDGRADLVAGAGPGGGPHVKVFDGVTGAVLHSFFAYDGNFVGGVNVATGDVDGDGFADVVTGAGPGAGPHVKVFSGADGSVRKSFFAFDGGFNGGVSVATGDYGGDGVADLIVGAGPGGGPHVRIFDGRTNEVRSDFFAFDGNFVGGVSLATGRFQGEDALFVGAGAGGLPQVNIFSLADGRMLSSLLAFDRGFDGGVNLAFARLGGRDTLLVAMASRGGTVGTYDVGSRRGDNRFGDSLAPNAPDSVFTPFGPNYMDGLSLAGLAAVPEPATWAQMILGFALAGVAHRRRLASQRALV